MSPKEVESRISGQESGLFRIRKRGNPDENQEIYRAYCLIPLILKVLQTQWEKDQEERLKAKEKQKEIFAAIWGKGEIPKYFSPSIAAYCFRWLGYEALAYKPAPPTQEASLLMMIGSASHWSLLNLLNKYFPGRQETSFTIDEADLSGRIDFLIKNQKTGRFQILELKFVGSYPFRQIKRKGLPKNLLSTKNIYQPTPEHYRQTLFYLWAKSKEGFDLSCANIIYINRDTGQMKEGLIVWDAYTQYEAEELIKSLKAAKEAIEKKNFRNQQHNLLIPVVNFAPFVFIVIMVKKMFLKKLKNKKQESHNGFIEG